MARLGVLWIVAVALVSMATGSPVETPRKPAIISADQLTGSADRVTNLSALDFNEQNLNTLPKDETPEPTTIPTTEVNADDTTTDTTLAAVTLTDAAQTTESSTVETTSDTTPVTTTVAPVTTTDSTTPETTTVAAVTTTDSTTPETTTVSTTTEILSPEVTDSTVPDTTVTTIAPETTTNAGSRLQSLAGVFLVTLLAAVGNARSSLL